MDFTAQLKAVDTFIRQGATQQAQDELTLIAKAPGALGNFDKIVESLAALNEPGVNNTVLDLMLPSAEFSRAQKLPYELKLIDTYINKKMRREAYKHLQKIVPLYKVESENLQAFAQRFAIIGEDTQALEIFEGLLKNDPENLNIERGIVRSMMVVKKHDGMKRLERFVKREGATALDWQFAADMFYENNMKSLAVNAARTSLSLGGDVLHCRRLLCFIWINHYGRHRNAAAEIRKIPLDQVSDIWVVRQLAQLAFVSKDKPLAISIAEEQWKRKKDDPGSLFFLISHLVLCDKVSAAKEHIDDLMALLEKSNHIDRKAFVKLAEICFKAFNSDALEIRAIELGLKYFPGDGPLSTAKTQHEVRQRFVVSHGAHGQGGAKSSVGLLDKLRRRLGGKGTAIT